jgi:hypothetical protein
MKANQKKFLPHQTRTNLAFQAKGIAYRSEQLASDIERFLRMTIPCEKAARLTRLHELSTMLREVGAMTHYAP